MRRRDIQNKSEGQPRAECDNRAARHGSGQITQYQFQGRKRRHECIDNIALDFGDAGSVTVDFNVEAMGAMHDHSAMD